MVTSLQCRRFLGARKCFCSRKRHVETSRREEEIGRVKGSGEGAGNRRGREEKTIFSPLFHCHKIKDGRYNNTNTNTNKVSPTQNTPALQAIR